jgi:hypothetical protein
VSFGNAFRISSRLITRSFVQLVWPLDFLWK